MVERTSSEGASAEHPAGGQNALPAPHSTLVEARPQLGSAAGGEVLSEDQADAVRLLFADHELAVPDIIAERDGAAHPHAPAPRRRGTVADALACQRSPG